MTSPLAIGIGISMTLPTIGSGGGAPEPEADDLYLRSVAEKGGEATENLFLRTLEEKI